MKTHCFLYNNFAFTGFVFFVQALGHSDDQNQWIDDAVDWHDRHNKPGNHPHGILSKKGEENVQNVCRPPTKWTGQNHNDNLNFQSIVLYNGTRLPQLLWCLQLFAHDTETDKNKSEYTNLNNSCNKGDCFEYKIQMRRIQKWRTNNWWQLNHKK